MILFATAVSIALVASFLCSVFESVLLSVSPAEIESLASRGRRSGAILRDFKKRIDVPIAAILIVNTIAHTIGATVAGASYAQVFSEQTLWIFSLVFTTAILLFTEIIPKTLGVAFAARLAGPVAHSVRALTVVLHPLVTLVSAISRRLRGSRPVSLTSIEEIRLLTAIGRNEGVVGARMAGIIEGATRLRHLEARDVLLPRQRVVMLSADMDRREIIDTIRRSGHSRFPFSPSGQHDNMAGIVLAKELLLALQDSDGPVDWQPLIREALVIPGSRALNSLLQAFRSERRHMAIVVDEYGGTEGIVTLEDVLEELVGDIVDESDQPNTEFLKQPDGAIDVKASVEMRKLCDYLGLAWDPDADVNTLGGYLLTLLDRVPRTGDAVDWHGYRLEVTKASDTRAEQVRLSPAGQPAERRESR